MQEIMKNTFSLKTPFFSPKTPQKTGKNAIFGVFLGIFADFTSFSSRQTHVDTTAELFEVSPE